MATGVETAGLVLAAFPLIISALEHYKEGLEPLKDFWKFRTDFLGLVHQIGYQKVVFDENIEELLSPVVDSAHELESLISNPGGPAWREPSLAMRLKERLPRSYEWYCGIMKELSQAITKLKTKLHISDENEARWLSYEKGSGVFQSMKWDFELNRLRIVLSKKKRERLLDVINKHNDSLHTLLDSSDRLAPLRKERKGKAAVGLAVIREQAASLYRVFCGCWPCMCPAHDHTTHLQLQPRLSKNVPNADGHDEKYAVKLASTFDVARPNYWNIAGVEIRVTQLPHPSDGLKPQAANDYTKDILHTVKAEFTAHNTTLSSSAKSNGHVKKKSVAFNTCASTAESTVVRTDRILDLCATLKTNNDVPDKPVGHLPDAQLEHLLYISQSPQEVTKQSITLASLLQQGIVRRQRLILAITMASSLLQLYRTKWLVSSWTKNDIIFLRDSENNRYDISKPFVAKRTCAYPVHPIDNDLDCDGRKALLHLGILLLELCFGKALEDQPFWSECLGPDGLPNRFTKQCAATIWQESVLEEGGELLSTAISRCINCNFGTNTADLLDSELRQAVHDNVVEQLQAVLRAHDGAII